MKFTRNSLPHIYQDMICILTFNCFLRITKFSCKEKEKKTKTSVEVYNTHTNKNMELVKTFWHQKQAFQQHLTSGVFVPETASTRFWRNDGKWCINKLFFMDEIKLPKKYFLT